MVNDVAQSPRICTILEDRQANHLPIMVEVEGMLFDK